MRLQNSLRLNSLFSGTSGLFISYFSIELGKFLNYENDLLYKLIGFGLITFSIFLGYISTKKPFNKPFIQAIILMDLGWVIGSIILVLLPTSISPIGKGLVLILALVVLILAILQKAGLKKQLQ